MAGEDDSFDVISFLKRVFPEHSHISAHPLSGGVLNQVWRAKLDHVRSVIVKWAPGNEELTHGLALSADRIHFEARALLLLAEKEPYASISNVIRTPELYYNDSDTHIIVMQDCGDLPHLQTHLSQSNESPFELAESLAQFMARLHWLSAQDPGLAELFHNTSVQKIKFAMQYQSIGSYLQLAGMSDSRQISRIQDSCITLGEILLLKGRCLIMGDLWPRSILIGKEATYLIDWEFAHYGNPIQDVAHLAAHLWMIADCAKDTGTKVLARNFLAEFLRCYMSHIQQQQNTQGQPQAEIAKKTAGASPYEKQKKLPVRLWQKDDLVDCALHFGTEILMRTVGPFQKGFMYENLSPSDDGLQEALRTATTHLSQPQDSEFFSRLIKFL